MKSHNPFQQLAHRLHRAADTRRTRLIDDEWQAFKADAAQWLADLDAKYDRLAAETRQSLDQLHRTQPPLRQRGLRQLWLPIAAGLGVFVAVTVASHSL